MSASLQLRFGAILTIAAIALFSLSASRADPAPAGRVLLVHDGNLVAAPPLLEFLRDHGQLEIVVADQAHLPSDWTPFRAVLGYVHNRLTDEAERKIIDYTKGGGRFVAVHHMISSWKTDNHFFLDFMGVQLDKPKASRNPVLPGEGYGWCNQGSVGVKVTLVNLNPAHYIVSHNVQWPDRIHYQSSDSLTVAGDYPAIVVPKSEVYVNIKFTDGREKTVLTGLSYTDPRNGAFFQQDRIGWVKRSGAGMIVYLQSGHFPEEFRNPNIAQMVLNAILWDGRNP